MTTKGLMKFVSVFEREMNEYGIEKAIEISTSYDLQDINEYEG